MTKKREELLGILLSQGDLHYLLPNVAIAEIFTLENMQQNQNLEAPNWVIGSVEWKQQQLPLLVYNNFVPHSPFHLKQFESAEQPRIAIINPLTQPGQPKYAVFCSKIPKLTRLKPQDLKESPPSSAELQHHAEHESIACSTYCYDDTAFIPNLIWIEEQIA